jgi:uncharacterized membrane protein HdeD (DUF308 family)
MTAPGTTSRLPRWAYLLFLVRGVVALALGIMLLAAGSDFGRLTTFVAVYWIVAALLTLQWVRGHRMQPHRRLGLLAGGIALAAGVAVLLRSLLDALLSRGVALDVLGASAIVTGLLRLSGTVHDDQLAREHPRRRYRFVVGVLEVLLGVTLVVAGEGASTQIRVALAMWGLSTGTFLLLDAFMLRRLTRSPAGSGT